MASPPFVFDETKPADADIVSQHPTDERSLRDNMVDWMDFEHGKASGRHKIPRGTVAARDGITDWETGSLWINTDATPNALQMNDGTKATPVWITIATVVITTHGDIIIGGSGAEGERLAVGAAEYALTSDGTDVAWGNLPDKIQKAQYIAGTSGGSANAYTLTLSPVIIAYAANQFFIVKIHATNTAPSTIDVDTRGVKNIFSNRTGAALVGGEMLINSTYLLYFDGIQFLLLNPFVAVASPFTLGTEQSTTSGTAKNFTGISTNAKRITVMLRSVAGTVGGAKMRVQIGDSGGIETSGYVGGYTRLDDASNIQMFGVTAGFDLELVSAADTLSGTFVLTVMDAATRRWVCSGSAVSNNTSEAGSMCGGSKFLDSALNRLRFSLTTGTFDNGAVNIMIEE